jgi:hypothetical protein
VVFHYFKFGIFKKLFLCFWELSCSDGIGMGVVFVYLMGMGLFME